MRPSMRLKKKEATCTSNQICLWSLLLMIAQSSVKPLNCDDNFSVLPLDENGEELLELLKEEEGAGFFFYLHAKLSGKRNIRFVYILSPILIKYHASFGKKKKKKKTKDIKFVSEFFSTSCRKQKF